MGDLASGLYLITRPHPNLEQILQECCAVGVRLIQIRDKQTTDEDLYRLVISLQQSLPSSVQLIVNDRINVAARCQTGLHVGDDDVSPRLARRRLGPDACIGVTIHRDIERAKDCAPWADYVGVGPVFQTHTKATQKTTIGIERLRNIVNDCPLPVAAIGGITETLAPDVWATGPRSIAVCGAIMNATNPARAAQRLLACIGES